MRIGSTIILRYESQVILYYFWWGCRGNLKLIPFGSERVNCIPVEWRPGGFTGYPFFFPLFCSIESGLGGSSKRQTWKERRLHRAAGQGNLCVTGKMGELPAPSQKVVDHTTGANKLDCTQSLTFLSLSITKGKGRDCVQSTNKPLLYSQRSLFRISLIKPTRLVVRGIHCCRVHDDDDDGLYYSLFTVLC